MAAGSTGSFFLAEVVMKLLLEKILVFEYDTLNLSDCLRCYALVFGQPYRIKPEFAFTI